MHGWMDGGVGMDGWMHGWMSVPAWLCDSDVDRYSMMQIMLSTSALDNAVIAQDTDAMTHAARQPCKMYVCMLRLLQHKVLCSLEAGCGAHLEDGMLDRPRLQPLLYFFKGLCLGGGASGGAGYWHALALCGPPACLIRVFFLLLGAIVYLLVFIIIIIVVWLRILQQPVLACLS